MKPTINTVQILIERLENPFVPVINCQVEFLLRIPHDTLA
jgi:hypothetical protein